MSPHDLGGGRGEGGDKSILFFFVSYSVFFMLTFLPGPCITFIIYQSSSISVTLGEDAALLRDLPRWRNPPGASGV